MKNILLQSLAVVLLIAAISCSKSKKEVYFNRINLDKTLFVTNLTDNKYLDTVVKVGLEKLNQKNVFVFIVHLSNKTIGEYELEAYIVPREYDYVIYIKDMTKEDAIGVIAHELIHLAQLRSEMLYMTNDRVIYNGISYPFDLDYPLRPWEIDAFNYSPLLEKEILEQLYSPKT